MTEEPTGNLALILHRLDNLDSAVKNARDELGKQIEDTKDLQRITNGRVTALEKAKLVHDGFVLAYGKFTPFALAAFGGGVSYAIARLLGA